MAEIVNPSQLETRQLQCNITLQSGTFKNGYNTITLGSNQNTQQNGNINQTINAIVTKSLTNNFTNSADITIYGMNESDISALSTLSYTPLEYQANKIELFAQYEGVSQSLCFSGFIVKAYCNFSDPSRPMNFECQVTYQNALNNVDPVNVNGSISIPTLFSNIAGTLGYSFQNNGVNGVINNPILTGSGIDQLKTLAKQSYSNCLIDNGIVKISPIGYSLSNLILNINSDSGLLSYPTLDVYGVKFRMRFNPVLNIGQYIALQTIVPIKNNSGQWYVYDMKSNLNNNYENWYTDIKCSYNNVDFG